MMGLQLVACQTTLYLGVKALDQFLDSEVEGIEWNHTIWDDDITLSVEPGSRKTSVGSVMIQTRAGNDIFRIGDNIEAVLGYNRDYFGVILDGGSGKDYLFLDGTLDNWDIRVSSDLEGFDIKPWGGYISGNISARGIEIVQGDDFTWTFGDRFPVMGAPDSRDNEDSQAIKNNLNSPKESSPPSSEGGTTIINNYITNTNTSVLNNTSNSTTTNISNSGSGNITVGNIGTVNNTTTIDNSFTIQTTNINLSLAITGDSKKSEKVEGTDGDDLIADGRGKDKLIGGDGADQFYFSGEEPFKKKTVDKVIDFDCKRG